MRFATLPTRAKLAAKLPRYEGLELTYAEVGASVGTLPPGYHHIDVVTDAGAGEADFIRLTDGLLRWRLQPAAGLVTAASAPTARPGVTVVNATGGVAGLLAPCRVTALVEEPRRRGFAYGALPGHPLVGEECFTAEWLPDDRVVLRICSFSNPAGREPAAAARVAQAAINRRYANAARKLAFPNGTPRAAGT